MYPKAVKARLLDGDERICAAGFCFASLPQFAEQREQPGHAPAGTECFDIFLPFPGDNDVGSQVERLNSIDTKIAPRSVRMAVGCADRAVICMGHASFGVGRVKLLERQDVT